MKQVKHFLMAATLGTLALSSSGYAGDTVDFINSEAAQKRGLPFSQAVQVGNTLYLSGNIGTDPKTGKLVPGGIAPETRQTMENIKAVLAQQNLTVDNLVKCTVMLADIGEWAAFNKEYVTFFDGQFPARSAFGASGLALGARTEVECIAHID